MSSKIKPGNPLFTPSYANILFWGVPVCDVIPLRNARVNASASDKTCPKTPVVEAVPFPLLTVRMTTYQPEESGHVRTLSGEACMLRTSRTRRGRPRRQARTAARDPSQWQGLSSCRPSGSGDSGSQPTMARHFE
jgi:hypothetical protein